MASLMSFCVASCGPLLPALPAAASAAAAAAGGGGDGGAALCGEGRGLVSLGRCQG